MKRQLIWLTASVAALGAGVASAQFYPSNPGYGYGDGYGQQVVRCESINSRSQRCRIDGSGEVRIARQLSRQQCIRGRNWDYNRNEIRVTDGCRADFAVMRDDRYGYNDRDRDRRNGRGYGRDQVVRCESRSQRRTYCGDGYGQYTMVGYRNANCVQGRTFGQDQRGLWVSGYCSAQFRLVNGNDGRYGRGDGRYDGQQSTVFCTANSSGRSYCGDANARYTLRDPASNRNCVEGRTWGTDQRGLWVSNPCQAEFVRYGNDAYPTQTYRVEPYSDRNYPRD